MRQVSSGQRTLETGVSRRCGQSDKSSENGKTDQENVQGPQEEAGRRGDNRGVAVERLLISDNGQLWAGSSNPDLMKDLASGTGNSIDIGCGAC